MSELFGFTLLYLIPGLLAAVFWFGPIRRLIAYWTHRDLMLSLIPAARAVHHSERILRTTPFTRNRT